MSTQLKNKLTWIKLGKLKTKFCEKFTVFENGTKWSRLKGYKERDAKQRTLLRVEWEWCSPGTLQYHRTVFTHRKRGFLFHFTLNEITLRPYTYILKSKICVNRVTPPSRLFTKRFFFIFRQNHEQYVASLTL